MKLVVQRDPGLRRGDALAQVLSELAQVLDLVEPGRALKLLIGIHAHKLGERGLRLPNLRQLVDSVTKLIDLRGQRLIRLLQGNLLLLEAVALDRTHADLGEFDLRSFQLWLHAVERCQQCLFLLPQRGYVANGSIGTSEQLVPKLLALGMQALQFDEDRFRFSPAKYALQLVELRQLGDRLRAFVGRPASHRFGVLPSLALRIDLGLRYLSSGFQRLQACGLKRFLLPVKPAPSRTHGVISRLSVGFRLLQHRQTGIQSCLPIIEFLLLISDAGLARCLDGRESLGAVFVERLAANTEFFLDGGPTVREACIGFGFPGPEGCVPGIEIARPFAQFRVAA